MSSLQVASTSSAVEEIKYEKLRQRNVGVRMPRIKSAKRYKVWGTKGFCCKFEDGCKAVYVMANRVFRRKTRQYLKLVKNGREIE